MKNVTRGLLRRNWLVTLVVLAIYLPAYGVTGLPPITVVTWGASTTMVTTNVNSPRGMGPGSISLSTTSPLTHASNYSDLPIYGGIQVSGSVVLTANRVTNNHTQAGAGNDVYDVRNTDPTPASGLMTALFLWENNYVPPSPREKNLYRLKALSYTGGYTPNSLMTAYFVVCYQKGSDLSYMISPTSISGSRLESNGGTHTIDAETASWYDYDPTTSAGLANIVASSALPDPNLSVLGVKYVGLLVQVNSRNVDCALSFYKFSATAEAWRKKPAFKALYNNDTGNVQVFDMRRSGYTSAEYEGGKFNANKLGLSIDEAVNIGGGTNNGADACMISPGFTHVPLWRSAIIDPDDHFAWWRYAHPMTASNDLSEIGTYMDPDVSLNEEGGDLLQAFIDHCQTRGVASFVSFRLNDYHLAQDVDARPGLWNIHPLGDIANDRWRFEHPNYRLGRAPLSTRPEYRYWDTDPATKDHELHTPGTWTDKSFSTAQSEAITATCLNWEIPEVVAHMRNLIEEAVYLHPGLAGIELDFPRAGFYFPIVPGGLSPEKQAGRRAIITGFVRDVRLLLNEVGRNQNRNYWLSVRIADEMLDAFGEDENCIDVRELAAEGVDMFVFCSRSSTHTIQVGIKANVDPDLGEIGTAIRSINPDAALYWELTQLAGSKSVYDTAGASQASYRWLATREQLKTTMHLAYAGSGNISGSGSPQKPWPVGIDGYSLYNFAYYRLARAPGSSTAMSEPPFDIMPVLKDASALSAESQHYHMGNREINPAHNTNKTFTMVLRKPSTNSGQWAGIGRLRLHSAIPIPAGAMIKVHLNVSPTPIELIATTYTVPYPQLDASGVPILDESGNILPQFRPPDPLDQILEWEVPVSNLIEGVNSFTVSNAGSGTVTFSYADLSIPAPVNH